MAAGLGALRDDRVDADVSSARASAAVVAVPSTTIPRSRNGAGSTGAEREAEHGGPLLEHDRRARRRGGTAARRG